MRYAFLATSALTLLLKQNIWNYVQMWGKREIKYPHPPGRLLLSRPRMSSKAAPLGRAGCDTWPWGCASVGWASRACWGVMTGAGYGCSKAWGCCLGLVPDWGNVLPSAFTWVSRGRCWNCWRCCCGGECVSFITGLSKGAPGGESAVAREVTTGMGEAVWSADAAGLAETTGIGMTVMGIGGGRGGAGAGGRGWWLRGSVRALSAQVAWLTCAGWMDMAAISGRLGSAPRDRSAFCRRSSSSERRKKMEDDTDAGGWTDTHRDISTVSFIIERSEDKSQSGVYNSPQSWWAEIHLKTHKSKATAKQYTGRGPHSVLLLSAKNRTEPEATIGTKKHKCW